MITDGSQVTIHYTLTVDGQHFRAFIAEIDGDAVTLDLNHPLAGKTLHFAVEVVAIE